MDMSVTVTHNELPTLRFLRPQSVLVPLFEERPQEDGSIVHVARLPFLGIVSYGETEDEAARRIGKMVEALVIVASGNVLSGRLSIEDVSEGLEEYDNSLSEWVERRKQLYPNT